MNKIEPIKRMFGVLDPAIHMRAAACAGMSLDWSGFIHDLQLFSMCCDLNLIPANHSHLAEYRSVRLPAFGATTHVVMSRLRADFDLDLITGAFAVQRSSGEV